MTFEDQINILVYFHLEEHHSGRHLLQVLKENYFARQYIAPEKEARLVGYRVANVDYWIATDRHDLSAEQIAFAYKLRWNIEIFFGWWKRHLKVYHLISRNKYGLMVQMLAGLITYLLLAIFCYNEHQENVSVKRLREICIKIRNETSLADIVNGTGLWIYQPPGSVHPYAIT